MTKKELIKKFIRNLWIIKSEMEAQEPGIDTDMIKDEIQYWKEEEAHD